MSFLSNFNYEEISNLFSNLASLTIWNLVELKKNYAEAYSEIGRYFLESGDIKNALNYFINYSLYKY